MLCRKRSDVDSTVNKEHNLSKSSSEQLGSTAEDVKKKRKKKSNAQKVLQLVYVPFIYHVSHSFSNKEFHSFRPRVVEIKTTA